MLIGEKFTHSVFNYYCRVIKYHSATKVEVVFPKTGTITTFRSEHLRRGTFKDPYHPTVYGMGYLGSYYKKERGLAQTKAYKTWKGMLERAYCPTFIKKNKAYKGVTVCDEWLHYTNFKAWFAANYIPDYHLDKDLKILGSKEYSPETCTFVPQHVNSLFTGYHTCSLADRGVHQCDVDGSWIYQCTHTLKGTRLRGRYVNKQDCILQYWKTKQVVVEEVISAYPSIPKHIKDSLRFLVGNQITKIVRGNNG